MKKHVPSILIWNLELSDKEDGLIHQNFYFLSYRKAKRFWERHEKELKEYKVTLGGEPLWLW